MDFRYLGPLEVVLSGERVAALGGPRQRSVLAVLLLRANDVVSTDTLVDQVWAGDPPDTAIAYVHNAVSRLRKELGPHVLETRPGGYVLHAGDEDIDARRFEHAVQTASSLEALERASALREALSVWRGQPFGDLAFESFTLDEARRLEELRLVAIENRVEAELEVGRNAELVPELAALVARNPTRERLRGLQMLALHAAGRRADALRTFQEARLALIDELGVEPGDELRAVERKILVDDPVPLAAAAATSSRKQVTVLYAEPEFAAHTDADSARAAAASFLAVVRAAVERHSGVPERLLDDEAIAFFGSVVAHEDDGLRAVRAAVEMQEELRAAGAAARVAIVSHETGVTRDSTMLADVSVDTARRLVEQSAPGSTLLSASILRLVGAAVDTVPADGAHGAFRVLRVVPDAPTVARRLDSPLIGREEELARLTEGLDDAMATRRCLRIALVGEAGIGKSRLARAFEGAVRDDTHVFVCRSPAYGEAATYRPLVEIVRQAVGRHDAQRRIEVLLSGRPDTQSVTAQLTPLVAGSAPQGSISATFGAVRALLEALGEERPVVIVLDDLHWAPPQLLDLVDYLAGWASTPMLLLCIGRPELLELRPEWIRDELSLEPLGDRDARRLAEHVRGVDDEAIDAAVDAADGNPLFLEQLLATAVEGDHGVPPSLEALLVSRFGRLDPAERAVLDRAAVAGRECWRGAIEALTDGRERGAIAERLISLVRRRLLRPAASSLAQEDAFVFHHVLIRDAAYGALTQETRALFHEELAHWLDGRPDAADEVVGFHLEQAFANGGGAGLALAAGSRLGRAGMAAWAGNDAPVAVDLLSRAVALLPVADPSRVELTCELGTALKTVGETRRAETTLDEAVALAQKHGLRQLELRATIERIWPRLMRGEDDPDECVRLVEKALPEFEASKDDRSLERAWRCVAAVRGRLQLRHGASEAAAQNALRHARRAGFPVTGYLSMLAADARAGPLPVGAALARCGELLDEASGDKGAEADVRLSLACLLAMQGSAAAARENLDRARALYDEFGYGNALQRDVVEAEAEIASEHDLERVECLLRTACAELEREGDTAWAATQTAALAELLYTAGRHDEALALSGHAIGLAHPGDVAAQVGCRRVRATALARAGHAVEGEALAREAIALADATDELNARGKSYLALAEVLDVAGRPEEAARSRREAARLFVAKGNELLAGRARS